MKLNDYEYLLNKIYQNGVYQASDIDADFYKKMQMEYKNLNVGSLGVNQMEGEFAFRKSFLIVRNYVQKAIQDGLRNFKYTMNAADINKLSYMVALLNRNFFDKRGLDQIISTANTVFSQYNVN
ncbi:hypothetical protein ACJVDH_01800 [Pedobacter sp. AW1-32]|uniref:hypothetical protein n=1 Tax=Pedobacter sp. AW1-32 TaxID=3383026 RepID=UPI003FEDEE36